MTTTEDRDLSDDPDLTAADVAWDLDPLLDGREVHELLDEADTVAAELASHRGRVAELDADGLGAFMARFGELRELLDRAGSWTMLRYSVDTSDEARGALLQRVEERATAIATQLLFFELEWAELPEERVDALLSAPRLDFCRHHLRSVRRYRPYLLTEPEERILVEKQLTSSSAWSRLFGELTSALEVDLEEPDGTRHTASLEEGLSRLSRPDREVRERAAEAVTAALRPGLRTRAFIFNTLLADKATEDRLRGHASWISARNLANEASDASVDALVDAVVSRYDIAQRWYRLKADILGVEQLADYDRMASVAESEAPMGWTEARDLVLDAYASFSRELAGAASRFFDEHWIDAPVRPGKRPGAFCAYTVPSHHPYVFLNWTGQRRDALTLAHELGHGLHAWLARGQGVFHQSTPLTLAETASVFGETVTFERLLAAVSDPEERLALLAQSLEGNIATVFRQIAMNRFEDAVHIERRETGELGVERFGDHWEATQRALLGDAVEITEGYRTWWSYVPHFIAVPGYVYAYAYGQLLALSIYQRYRDRGQGFVSSYLELLRTGGSRPPEELAKLVDCDLEDPSFWGAGLDLVDDQLRRAREAAVAAGRVPG